MVALVNNWWNLFVPMAEPDRCLEASRPLLSGIGKRIRHCRRTTLRVTSSPGRAGWARRVLSGVARFLAARIGSAEQLTVEHRWTRSLSHALRIWLKGFHPPARLLASPTYAASLTHHHVRARDLTDHRASLALLPIKNNIKRCARNIDGFGQTGVLSNCGAYQSCPELLCLRI